MRRKVKVIYSSIENAGTAPRDGSSDHTFYDADNVIPPPKHKGGGGSDHSLHEEDNVLPPPKHRR